jgi:putative membrane protein
MQIVLVLILILAVLLVIFTLQNPLDITLNVFFWEIPNAPLVLVLISCVIVGYILAAIYLYPKLWKVKTEYKQLIKFNKELKTLHELNHPKAEEIDPEGIELDDDDGDSFFKDD